jgi:hypothetical protein
MDEIVTWITTYSPPVALLLMIGAALVFVLKLSVEKTIDTHFQQQNKILSLPLELRSRFDERILLDRYQKVSELQTRFSKIMIDLRRHFGGTEVPDLLKGNEVVPLTYLFQDVADYRYLLTDRFYDILYREAQLALEFANSGGDVNRFASRHLALQDEFRGAMNEVFGIEKISYVAPALAGLRSLSGPLGAEDARRAGQPAESPAGEARTERR